MANEPMNEFSLIDFIQEQVTLDDPSVILGIGDDCAIVEVPAGQQLAVSMDTLVSGIHFLDSIPPKALGYRVLAVNLSDLAAMGAAPRWVTLALTLPNLDPQWIREFTSGFLELARVHHVTLIGGDLTRGPLAATCQVQGFLPQGQGLKRSRAQQGDFVCVSGTLGAPLLGVLGLTGELLLSDTLFATVREQFYYPMPRVELGLQLLPWANACIDISDGLAADLNHILQQSKVGAILDWKKLPVAAEVQDFFPQSQWSEFVLHSGDEYQLCFTIAESNYYRLPETVLKETTVIGKIVGDRGIWLKNEQGNVVPLEVKGYRHF